MNQHRLEGGPALLSARGGPPEMEESAWELDRGWPPSSVLQRVQNLERVQEVQGADV